MLTIIIPTMNRADFAIRLLDYYASQVFPHPVFVGDSSDAPQAERLQSAVERLSGHLRVSWFDCRELNNYEVMRLLLSKVATPYASYLADDDFLVAPALQECIAFMNAHPDYAGACGKALLFNLKEKGPYGPFEAASSYPEFSLEDPSPGGRLAAHLSSYTSSFHAVCRTPVLRRAVENALELKKTAEPGDKSLGAAWRFSELLTSCSVIVQGKLKVLESLHYVRQVHEGRYLFPAWFQWVTSSNWHACFQIFKTQLLRDMEVQGISREEGDEAFQKAFRIFLEDGALYSRKRGARKNGGLKKEIRATLRQWPVARVLWRQLRSVRQEMSLEALSRRTSPHHEHFMPIYSLVTQKGRNAL